MWCRQGVLVAGVAFGVLHNSGGRNWAFAVWASAVGVVYGAAFLATEVRNEPMLTRRNAGIQIKD